MTTTPRTIAIGDIHGCFSALDTIMKAIDPTPDDLIVTLGDYVDRGPKSKEVLEYLSQLRSRCRLIPILGNHDDMFLQAIRGSHRKAFLSMGGDATLRSYGGSTSELNYALVPRSHIAFLESCVNYFETETHFFLHASYVSTLPLADQPILALRWESLRDEIPPPHFSGKTAIVGHTSQKNGKILNKGYLVCIDTNCAGGGWLTAVDIHSGRIWQASRDGKLRSKLRIV